MYSPVLLIKQSKYGSKLCFLQTYSPINANNKLKTFDSLFFEYKIALRLLGYFVVGYFNRVYPTTYSIISNNTTKNSESRKRFKLMFPIAEWFRHIILGYKFYVESRIKQFTWKWVLVLQ